MKRVLAAVDRAQAAISVDLAVLSASPDRTRIGHFNRTTGVRL